MAENVGSIFYTVDADTGKVISGLDALESSVGTVNKTLSRTDAQAARFNTRMTATAQAARQTATEIEAAGRQLDGLRAYLAGFLSLQGVSKLREYADSYTDLQNRLRLVTDGQKQLADATSAVFTIANSTSQAVGSIGQVYQRFAQNAKDLGLNMSQVARLSETVAKAVATSGASAASADAALVQFGQALASGTLRGEELNSVMEQTPALAAAIARGMGITVGELRAVAAEGQITSQKLVEALQKASGSVDEQFNTRVKTIGQSFVELNNALTEYVGVSATANGSAAAVANAIGVLAQNLDNIATVALALGAGALAKLIVQLGIKTVATLRDAAATRASALAEINLARAQVATAQAALANTTANTSEAAAKAVNAARTDALAAANLRLAAANRAAGTAGAVLASTLGGPVGIIGLIATAAAGIAMFASSGNAAAESMRNLDGPLSTVSERFAELNASQQKLAITAATDALTKSTQDLGKALDGVSRGTLVSGGQTQWTWIRYAGTEMQALNARMKSGEISAAEYDKAVVGLVDGFASSNRVSKEWRAAMLELVSAASETAKSHADAKAKVDALTGAAQGLDAAARGAAGALREMSADAGIKGDPGKYLKSLTDSVGKLQDAGSRVKEAQRQIEEWGTSGVEVGESVKTAILSAAYAADNLAEANKRAKASTSEHGKAENERKKALKDNVDSLEKMAKELERASKYGEALAAVQASDKLNKFATPEQVQRAQELGKAMFVIGEQAKAQQGLQTLANSLATAGLRGRELAETQAVLSLGAYATTEQIESARQLGSLLYEANYQKSLLDKIGEGDVSKYIRGDVQPLTGGAFDNQAARYDQEAVKEQERYQASLVRLQEAMEAEKLTLESYYSEFEKLSETHNSRMSQIASAKYSSQVSSASEAFGNIADATKAFAGEQSGIYKAMFAVSKAFAIADAIVKIQQGIANAAATPFPGNIAAMASVASATAGIISTISGTSLGGGRLYGGNVGPDKMHRINENGKPEILNTANGQQYLLPNTRGKVVSNADASSGGGSVDINAPASIVVQTYVTIEPNSSSVSTSATGGQGQQGNAAEQIGDMMGSMLRDFLERERRPGGILWNITNNR